MKYLYKSLFILLLFFIAHPTFAAPALVQQKVSETASTATTVTLDSFPKVGNIIIVLIGHAVTATVSSITHSGSPGGVLVKRSAVNRSSEIWYVAGTDGTSKDVVINKNVAGASTQINVSEWSGISIANVFGASKNGAFPANPVLTATLAKSQNLIIAIGRGDATITNAGPGGGFTALTGPSTNLFSGFAYRIASNKGSYSTSWACSGGCNYDSQIVAFSTVPHKFIFKSGFKFLFSPGGNFKYIFQ